MKLTAPQREALAILADQEEPIGAWKRSSTREPIPRLNIRAVGELCHRGLARCYWPSWLTLAAPPPSSVFTHDNRYAITDKGRETNLQHPTNPNRRDPT